MNQMMTKQDQAKTLQAQLLAGFNYASISVNADGEFEINVTSGNEVAIKTKADKFLGEGTYKLKMPSITIGK